MADDWVQEFISALHRLEDTGDVEALARQFSPEAHLWNLATTHPQQGLQGARDFWQGYRRQFNRVHSTFDRIIVADGQAALEWHTEGTLRQGDRPIEYRGVSILRRDERGIKEFAGYYDPRPFLAALRVSEAVPPD